MNERDLTTRPAGRPAASPRAGRPPERFAARILIVEDDAMIREMVTHGLEMEGFVVESTSDGLKGLNRIRAESYSLVVLDLGLPRMDGVDVLSAVRAESTVPVIVMTARTSEADRLLALEMGADDYMIKPVYPRELAARVRAVLRRAGGAYSSTTLVHGELSIDTVAREVMMSGRVVELTAREFDLLAFLASYPRQVFTRSVLLDRVWGSSSEWQDPATVTEHIRRLRVKLGTTPDNPSPIETVRGVGYRFLPSSG